MRGNFGNAGKPGRSLREHPGLRPASSLSWRPARAAGPHVRALRARFSRQACPRPARGLAAAVLLQALRRRPQNRGDGSAECTVHDVARNERPATACESHRYGAGSATYPRADRQGQELRHTGCVFISAREGILRGIRSCLGCHARGRGQDMASSTRQLTIGELEERFRGAKDVVERSHCQAIWLLAKGHSTAEVAELVALSPRWVSQLRRRYEAEGADALGIGGGGTPGPCRCCRRPIWRRCGSVSQHRPTMAGCGPARRWLRIRDAIFGLVHVHAPRGWEALQKLGWSLQAPRPKNPRGRFLQRRTPSKNSPTPSPRRWSATPARRLRSGPPTSIGSA